MKTSVKPSTTSPRWVRRMTARLRAPVANDTASAPPTMDDRDEGDDLIDEVGRGSFPASDPPPWTLGIDRPLPPLPTSRDGSS